MVMGNHPTFVLHIYRLCMQKNTEANVGLISKWRRGAAVDTWWYSIEYKDTAEA